jgi:hypothetical protein
VTLTSRRDAFARRLESLRVSQGAVNAQTAGGAAAAALAGSGEGPGPVPMVAGAHAAATQRTPVVTCARNR